MSLFDLLARLPAEYKARLFGAEGSRLRAYAELVHEQVFLPSGTASRTSSNKKTPFFGILFFLDF